MMNKTYSVTDLSKEEYDSLCYLLNELRFKERKKAIKKNLEANIMALINDVEVQIALDTSEIYEVLNEVNLNVALNE